MDVIIKYAINWIEILKSNIIYFFNRVENECVILEHNNWQIRKYILVPRIIYDL